METLIDTLQLRGTVFENIDPDLLELAFIDSSVQKTLPPEKRQRMVRKYGSSNYESFEFLGDAILEMIATVFVLRETGIQTATLISEITNNQSLSCMLEALGLDQLLPAQTKMTAKTLGDVFEALIGVLYWHVRDQGFTSLGYIEDYLDTVWNFGCYVRRIIAGNEVCNAFSPVSTEDTGICGYDRKSVMITESNNCVSRKRVIISSCTTPLPVFESYTTAEKIALLQEQMASISDDLDIYADSSLVRLRAFLEDYDVRK